MIVGGWYVQLVAMWHCYLPYAFSHFFLFSVLSFFDIFLNLLSVNLMEWAMMLACPSLMSSFNRGNAEGAV